jgi:hypothetical protein
MTDASGSFLGLFEGFAGDALRDVWVFDEDGQECLYIRDDVSTRLDGHDPERYIDNERYGFITRRTYDDLTYASYQYTVRGFDEFTTFRTFLGGFGVLASVDRGPDHDFGELFDRLCETAFEYESVSDVDESLGARLTADD